MQNKWISAFLIMGIIASVELAASRRWNIRRKPRQRSYPDSRTRYQGAVRTTRPSQTRTGPTQRPKVNPLQHSPRTIVRAPRVGKSPVTTRPPFTANTMYWWTRGQATWTNNMFTNHADPTTFSSTPPSQVPPRLEEVNNMRPGPWKGNGSFTGDLKLHCRKNGTCSGGIVQVYNREKRRWGTICGDNWHNRNAEVVCKFLGFGTGSARKRVSRNQTSAIKRLPNFMKNVDCKGDEWALTDCAGGKLMLYRNCKRKLAGVKCIGKLLESRGPCPKSTTQCEVGDRCIDQNHTCNMIADCPWGTDEIGCRKQSLGTSVSRVTGGWPVKSALGEFGTWPTGTW